MHREAQQRGDSNFLEREPLQSWLGDAIFSTDTDEFRRNVADNARELDESVADTSVLVHRLAEWKIDIKSGGRPVGLYVPRLVLEREITVVDPKFDLYRDNDEPSGQAGFAEAHQRLLADPSLANDWLVLTAAFGKTFADYLHERHGATRIRLFRGVRGVRGDPGEIADMAHDQRLRWARENLRHGTVENWSPLPGVAEGALSKGDGIVIGAEFDTTAGVCTHQGGAETNVRPWRVDAGRVLGTFRYTSIEVHS